LPKDEAQPALDAPGQTPVTAPRRGNGLAIVALLLGAAGVAAGGWGIWQVRTLQASNQQQLSQVKSLDDQSQTLKQSQQQLAARLAQLPGADELEERRACWPSCGATSSVWASAWKPCSGPAARTGAWQKPNT